MKKTRQNGSLTIEAAFILAIFIVGYVAITTAADFIRAQMIIQYSISQAAKEISSYCYLVSKTGILEDSYRLNSEADKFKSSTDTLIDTTVKLYDAIDSGIDSISESVQPILECRDLDDIQVAVDSLGNVDQEKFNEIVSAANTVIETSDSYFENPKQILKGIGSLIKDGALSAAKSYIIAAPLSKALVKKQVALYGTNSQGKDVLEALGVVGGLKGLNFTGSCLFNDGETITIQVSYSMEIPYPGLREKKLHFIQKASTRAWGAKEHE